MRNATLCCHLIIHKSIYTIMSVVKTTWKKVPNVAQYKGADWNNEVKRVSGTTLEGAMQIAESDSQISFFFFMKSSMFLEGKAGADGWTQKGQFNPGDAVFFSGNPWYGSAPQADAYQKEDVCHSFESFNFPGYYIRHRNFLGYITEVSSELDKKDSTFKMVKSLADPDNENTVSFESVNYPGYYLRHQNFRIHLHKLDGSQLFKEDATFHIEPGNATGNPTSEAWQSYRSFNYPDRYIRHRNFELWLDAGSDDLFKKDTTFRPVAPNWE